MITPASWSSNNVLVSGAGGLRFKFPAVQVEYRAANGSPSCDITLKGAVLPWRNDAEMGPANSLHALA